MRGGRARLGRVALGVAVLLAALGAVGLGGTSGAGAQTSANGSGSQGCARVDVLLLIDQSASLRNTDPDDLRVVAAEGLLRSLAASAESGGTTIDVTVAGFGTGAAEVGRAALPADLEGAIGAVQPFADRDTDLNTDYVLALAFAVQHFQAVTDLPSECKRMVWFTDGAYSIDDTAAPGIAGYTTSTNRDAIVAELGGQVCGALPESSRLTAPLSQQIRQAGFVVQLVDLRTGGTETEAERRDREATAPVIDRLLSGNPNDGCTVPGGRVQADQANDLAAEFFTQGQLALGRRQVTCADLATGYPGGLVRAVTLRGTAPDQPLEVAGDGGRLAAGNGFVSWVLPPDGPPQGGTVRGTAGRGEPASCYADLSASITPVGAQRIDPAADSTTLAWAVLGVGRSDAAVPGDRLGPESVQLSATVDGRPTDITWDEGSRTWTVTVPGPVDAVPEVVVTASADRWGTLVSLSSALEEGASLAPPTVRWAGPTRFEGAGEFGGRIAVVPAPLPAGAPIPDGVVCLELEPATASADFVQVQAAESRVCHPAGEPFEVNARVVVSGDHNTTVTVRAPYTVVHRPAGASDDIVVSTGDAELPSFELAKPVDAAQGALLAAAVVVLSTLVPLFLLLFLVNQQRKLPRPSTRAVAWVPLTADGGAVDRVPGADVTDWGATRVEGSTTHYRLPSGLSLDRPRTLNPFAATVVDAHSEGGPVTAVPWMAPGAGRSVQVPARFTWLVLIRAEPGSDTGEAVVVGPADGTAAEADAAVDRALATTNELWGRVSGAMRLLDL